MPIIPVGSKTVGFNAVKQAPSRIVGGALGKLESENNAHLDALFNPAKKKALLDKQEQEKKEQEFKANANVYYQSTTPSAFDTHFGVDYKDTKSSLDTLDKAIAFRASKDFEGKKELQKQYEEREKQVAQELWDTQINSGKNLTDDPENPASEAAKVKANLELLLTNENIKKANILDTIAKNEVKIGTKTYKLQKKADDSGYELVLSA